ncbi:hypothetical protein ISN44_As09g010410 [Arabidopsis suecica]|uniref:Uncharacterized protein n=1 Tax=Arabidopsis suecica TaxID=45249 RepID=A0A8T2AGQ7_ARASU|nr:hypothetical protein ISN44_As09g010410 [Arabidopsis suecica]
MHPESTTICDDMMDTSSDRGTDTGIPTALDVQGLPPLNPEADRIEPDPLRRLLFTPNTGREFDAVHTAPPPAALAVAAAAEAAAAEAAATARPAVGAAPGRTGAADQGTHLDDVVQTILELDDLEDAQTTERIDALVVAQVASQSQIKRLRHRRRDSQLCDDRKDCRLHVHELPNARRTNTAGRHRLSLDLSTSILVRACRTIILCQAAQVFKTDLMTTSTERATWNSNL